MYNCTNEIHKFYSFRYLVDYAMIIPNLKKGNKQKNTLPLTKSHVYKTAKNNLSK
jgi:hypothetical protein